MKRLYEKHKGKLIPVKEFDRYRKWSEGYYFVRICKGSRGYKVLQEPVEPDNKRLYAAMEKFKEILINSLNEASKTRVSKEVTPEAGKLFRKLMKELGPASRLYFDSMNDIVENALKMFEEQCRGLI